MQKSQKTNLLNADDHTYQQWKLRKINALDEVERDRTVAISALERLTGQEIAEITTQCRATNLCFYRCQKPIDDTRQVKQFGQQLKLGEPVDNPQADEHHISSIQKIADAKYIPYSDAPLHWHTDGYYNDASQAIHAFIMHCVQPAEQGGSNTYFDHEMLYILLRDENPQYIKALCHPHAMTIPANTENGQHFRPQQSGAVFAIDAHGNLSMRYTARRRNVIWHEQCTEAVQCLSDILANNEEYKITRRLAKGEGVVCNNVVHNRTAYQDSTEKNRLLLRARYHNRIPAI